MTTLAIRRKLITYLADADDSKVKALYTLLESEIDEKKAFILTEEQKEILNEEQRLHVGRQSKSYSREEAIQLIKGQTINSEQAIESIFENKYVVMSIIGSHAGDEISFIFSWKRKEIQINRKTYWLIRSSKAQTKQVQKFCERANKEGENVYCLFITASTKNGSRSTTTETQAKEFSKDKNDWFTIEDDVKIKGKIDSQSTALVLSELEVFNKPKEIDLGNYSEIDIEQNINPVKFRLGASTSCCEKIPSIVMKSGLRTIVAWGKLDTPYAVWVR